MLSTIVAAPFAFSPSTATADGPCDITGKAGNPCVAAHSTTRALFAAYDGPLYQVTRSSDGKSADVGVLKAGGFANIATHETFCAKLDCVIAIVYDQSPQGNHLGQRHQLVPASRHKIHVGDHSTPVYGMWFEPGYGYHVDNTTGIATGNEEESIFAVMSGTHFNGGCCFDYGNSETDDRDDGCGTMEAIYFGNAHWNGNTGAGDTGPWVGADLEQGMYYGGGEKTQVNNQSKPLPHEFVSLYLRGRTDGFMLKGGDATAGKLETMYDGPRPDRTIAGFCGSTDSYQPMRKQGAIILATGGDNSNSAQGKFYEGIMVTGTTTDATDEAVQANIIGVKYKNIPAPPATALGCYKDAADHDLPISASKGMVSSDALQECGELCASYKYFALEYGKECRCGDSYGKYGKSSDPATDCNMPCENDESVTCGGNYKENVYSH